MGSGTLAAIGGVLGNLPVPPLTVPPAFIQTLMQLLPGLDPSSKVISLQQCGSTQIYINTQLIPKSVLIYSGCHNKTPQIWGLKQQTSISHSS